MLTDRRDGIESEDITDEWLEEYQIALESYFDSFGIPALGFMFSPLDEWLDLQEFLRQHQMNICCSMGIPSHLIH